MDGDELRPGRLRLEQLERLGEQLLGSWIAESVDDEAQARQGTAGSYKLALLAVEVGSLLERLPRILQSALLLRRLPPSLHQRRAHGMAWRDELEGDSELPLSLVDVECERPLTGQGEVAHRLRL